MNIKQVNISDIKPAEYNPRKMSIESMNGLEASIKKFGQQENLIVNKDMTLISGHQRLIAMKNLGFKDVQCSIVDLGKIDEKALNLTMNNQAISGEYDKKKLEPLLIELSSLEEFENLKLDELALDELEDIDLTDIKGNQDRVTEGNSKQVTCPQCKYFFKI